MKEPSKLQLSTTAFDYNGRIPSAYTCDGVDSIPPLYISNVPEGTQSLVLFMDDPEVNWVHWVKFNIPPTIGAISEGESPEGVDGKNSWGTLGYRGSCPPRETEHEYFFKLYALDTLLGLREGATKEEVMAAMDGHIMEQAEIMGRYKRK